MRSRISFHPRNPRFESVFAEEQFVDAAEDFFDADGCGEKAVAAEDSAGHHLAFGTEVAERENGRVFERGVAVDLALNVATVLVGSFDKDEDRLTPTGGVERQFLVVLFVTETY